MSSWRGGSPSISERLQAAVAALGGPQAGTAWAAALLDALDDLAEAGDAQAWQRSHAGRRIAEATGRGRRPAPMSCLTCALRSPGCCDQRATRANFRTGEITVAGLMPMRFVPHRVVAIIGLDDGAVPAGRADLR